MQYIVLRHWYVFVDFFIVIPVWWHLDFYLITLSSPVHSLALFLTFSICNLISDLASCLAVSRLATTNTLLLYSSSMCSNWLWVRMLATPNKPHPQASLNCSICFVTTRKWLIILPAASGGTLTRGSDEVLRREPRFTWRERTFCDRRDIVEGALCEDLDCSTKSLVSNMSSSKSDIASNSPLAAWL